MKSLQTYVAVTLVGSIFLIFLYSSLKTEVTHSHRTAAEDSKGVPDPPVPPLPARTSPPNLAPATTPQLNEFNVSIAAAFRDTIPHNSAYWNRLLYSALGPVGDGKYTLRRDAGRSQCEQTSQELLKTNVHDFDSYPDLFRQFLYSMKCRSPQVLINQPSKCTSDNGGTFMLFAIKSNPGNFVRRQVIRETWGKEQVYGNNLKVRTIFLLGSTPPDMPSLTNLVSYEAKQYGDLLQWDFHESLLNLTLKATMFLGWTVRHCPNVSFVFSGDDDVFVNTPGLMEYLKSLDSSKASVSYIGHIIDTASPHRDSKSKYFIPPTFYDGPYPPYAGGGGFLLSGTVIKPLYHVAHLLPLYPIDDVYIGMCFKALGISPQAHVSFQTFDVAQQDRSSLCVHKALFLIHQRSPVQVKRLWKGIHSPLLTC